MRETVRPLYGPRVTTGWEVPGYRTGRLLGFGPLGEVWEGVRHGDGVPVVLRRLSGFDPAEVAQALDPLQEVPGEHRVRLLEQHEVDGDVVLVVQRAARPLCGPLTPSQAVTALAPIALVLGAAHDAGLAHGRLTAREILLDSRGRPLLDGLGISALLGSADDDARALVQIARDLVPEPGPLTAVLDRHWDDVDAFGRALLASCTARPLVGGPEPEPQPRRPHRVRALLAAVVALVLAGTLVAQRLTLARAPGDRDWSGVLAGLDRARGIAFDAVDERLLSLAYTTDSPELQADRRRLAALAAAHLRTKGLRHRLVSCRPVQTTADRVELDVRMGLDGYDLLGPVRSHVPPGPVVQRTVLLMLTAAGWRVGAIT